MDVNASLSNWAGNIVYSTDRVFEAASVDEIRAFLRSHEKLRVLGSRHCFNTIADSSSNLLSLNGMQETILDVAAGTVTVGAGVNYGQLGLYLDAQGFALHNLASLPHISIAGAIATATHGSGEQNGNLSAAVTALELVSASGDLVQLDSDSNPSDFRAAVAGLGAFGVITRIWLKVEPAYQVCQYVYENLPLAAVRDHFDEIQRSGYSVSLFTVWREQKIDEL